MDLIGSSGQVIWVKSEDRERFFETLTNAYYQRSVSKGCEVETILRPMLLLLTLLVLLRHVSICDAAAGCLLTYCCC